MNIFSITTMFAEVRVEYNGTEEQPRMAVEELLWNPELSGVENFLHVSTVGGRVSRAVITCRVSGGGGRPRRHRVLRRHHQERQHHAVAVWLGRLAGHPNSCRCGTAVHSLLMYVLSYILYLMMLFELCPQACCTWLARTSPAAPR